MNVKMGRFSRSPEAGRRFDENGNLIRGQTERGVWDDIDRLVEYCHEQKMDRIGDALRQYEQERQHLLTAIENLEIQLTAIADKHREYVANHGRLVELLERANIDPEIIIQTDDIFGNAP